MENKADKYVEIVGFYDKHLEKSYLSSQGDHASQDLLL